MSDHTRNKSNPMKEALQSEKKCKQESKTHRSVSFSDTKNETRKVLALDDYSDEEIARTWYNEQEQEIIAHKCHKIIRKLKNNSIDSGQYCIRGLEGTAGARKSMINYNRRKAYDAVLYEQEAQFEDERDDQELIAQLYRAVSAQCQIEATERGLNDEHAVERYLSCARRVPVQDDLPEAKMAPLPPSPTPPFPRNRRSCVATTA
jgi:hypothetical protein